MSISVAALRTEYKIRTWQRIIGENPYIAVLQLTGGSRWGRTNMKWRILGAPNPIPDGVSARFATPAATREGALRTRFPGIAELFRSAPCAVVYGTQVEAVMDVVRRAEDLLNDAELVGGRFGDRLVHAQTWREALASEGEVAQFTQLVGALEQGAPLVRTLEAGGKGLAGALDQAAGRDALAGVLTQHATNLESGSGAATQSP